MLEQKFLPKYKQISKRTARKYFESGKTIILAPNRITTIEEFEELSEHIKFDVYKQNFDLLCYEFKFYRNNLDDIGKGISFYVEGERPDE